MTPERKALAERLLSQIPPDYDGVQQITALVDKLQGEVLNLYEAGKISKQETIEDLVQLSLMMSQKATDISTQIATGRAYEDGYETLANDLSGARDAEWFDRTKRAFSTGLVSSGIGVGIIHPDIGMAAANINTVTEEDIRASYAHGLENPTYQALLLTYQSPLLMVSSESLQRTTARALDQTFREFDRIAPNGIPKTGTLIVVFGVDYAGDIKIETIKQATLTTIQHHPMMNDGRLMGQDRQIHMHFGGLGHERALIYGGRNHPNPNYRKPAIYMGK